MPYFLPLFYPTTVSSSLCPSPSPYRHTAANHHRTTILYNPVMTLKMHCHTGSQSAILLTILSLCVCIYSSSSSSLTQIQAREINAPSITKFDEAIPSLEERGLITLSPDPQLIVDNCDRYGTEHVLQKSFKGASLGYVTPWNSHGYDVAKFFGKKFTHVSPVWLQMKLVDRGEKVEITGVHDIDSEFVEDLHHHGTKVVPRVLLEMSAEHIVFFFSHNAPLKDAIRKLNQVCDDYNFDGLVLEMTAAWPTLRQRAPKRLPVIERLLKSVSKRFKKAEPKRDLVLVLPPVPGAGDGMGILAHEVHSLLPHVDYYSIMTYDYSNAIRPGPSSPIGWVQQVVTAYLGQYSMMKPITKKFLLGLNMYGMDFTDGKAHPKLGRDVKDILSSGAIEKIEWDEAAGENYVRFGYTGSDGNAVAHTMYFPTTQSIAQRLKLATQLEVGVAIWELGQGMDMFYELF
jgi:chitinase domain-containing protein 1